MTQQAMAERLRVGYRTYQTWEAGTMPEWPNLEKLAYALGVRPEDLVGEEQPPAEGQLDRIERKLDAVIAALAEDAERRLVDEATESARGPEADDEEPGEASGEE